MCSLAGRFTNVKPGGVCPPSSRPLPRPRPSLRLPPSPSPCASSVLGFPFPPLSAGRVRAPCARSVLGGRVRGRLSVRGSARSVGGLPSGSCRLAGRVVFFPAPRSARVLTREPLTRYNVLSRCGKMPGNLEIDMLKLSRKVLLKPGLTYR